MAEFAFELEFEFGYESQARGKSKFWLRFAMVEAYRSWINDTMRWLKGWICVGIGFAG
jgi:hypothetical protein